MRARRGGQKTVLPALLVNNNTYCEVRCPAGSSGHQLVIGEAAPVHIDAAPHAHGSGAGQESCCRYCEGAIEVAFPFIMPDSRQQTDAAAVSIYQLCPLFIVRDAFVFLSSWSLRSVPLATWL